MKPAKQTPGATEGEEARHSFDGLDRVLHEKARLGILTALASRPQGLLFAELKVLLRTHRRQSQPPFGDPPRG